jgi:hypothetical protein
MEFSGRILRVFPTSSGTNQQGNTWKRQEFIFEYFERPEDRYCDRVLLSIMNERIDTFDIHEGDEVRIGFGHNVREWNGKWYNEMRVYRLEKISHAPQGEPEPSEAPQPASAPIIEQPKTEEEDDLPF